GSVEPVCREGTDHRIALAKVGGPRGGPRARKGKLRLGRIDALHLGGRASFGQQLGEGAAAAADIDPSQALRRGQPVEKDVARQPAPGTHHALVGSAVLEAYLSFSHQPPFARPLLSEASPPKWSALAVRLR